jgi:hypothetical protein
MKVHGDQINEVDSANLMAKVAMGIDKPEKIILNTLVSLYTVPWKAGVVELVTNAVEAMDMADRGHIPIYIHLPTMLEPYYSVTDTGIGIGRDNLIKYNNLGASTKDEDNETEGGFGLGMKVGLAIGEEYTVISRYEGTECAITCYKDEYNIPSIVQLYERSTTERNGTEVRIPVPEGTFDDVKKYVKESLQYFNDPRPETNLEVEWPENNYTQTGEGWGLIKREGYRGQSRIIMGRRWYPVDSDQVREDRLDKYSYLLDHGVDIHVPIGSVKLPMSRESILYVDTTIEVIRKKADKVIDEVIDGFQKDIEKQPNIYQAIKMFKESASLIQGLTKKLADVTYKGVAINRIVYCKSPCPKLVVVPQYRWRYKSLSLQDYTISGNVNGDLPITVYDKNYQVFIIHESTKKVPSRLLRYMHEHHPEDQAILFYYKDNTKAKVRRWVYTTYGWKVTQDFGDVVPDYKVQRNTTSGVQRKTAKALEFIESKHRMWNTPWWSDKQGEIDLDNSTGVWINVRKRTLQDSKYIYDGHDSQLDKVIQSLKKYDIVPVSTPIYGCPGSHKNKLKDHPNFIHIDEAINQLFELKKDMLTPLTISKMNYVKSMSEFIGDHKEIFSLDIAIDKSYYSLCKQRALTFNKNLNAKSIYDIYNACLQLNGMGIREKGNEYGDDLVLKSEALSKKFFKRYPLLKHVNLPYDPKNEHAYIVEDYINLKENCNV